MNIYSFFPLSALFANLFFCMYIFYINPKKRLNRLYSFFTFFISVWSFGHFNLFNSISNSEAMFWKDIATLGSIFTAVLIFHFALVFTKNRFSRKFFYILPIYILGGFLVYLEFTTTLFTKSMHQTYWGMGSSFNITYPILPLTVFLLAFSSVILYSRVYFKTSSNEKKHHAKFLIIALSIPLVGGIITQLVSPIIGFEILPLTSGFTTISAAIIGFSVFKHNLLIPKYFGIRKKIVAILLISILILSFTFLLTTDIVANKEVVSLYNTQLSSTAHSKANSINIYLESVENQIILTSQGPGFLTFLKTDEDNASYIEIYSRVKKRLNSSISDEIYCIFILNRDGKIVFSTAETDIGKNKSNQSYFTEGLNKTYITDVFYSNDTGKYSIVASTPIKDNSKNETCGVLVAKIETQTLNEIVTDTSGLKDREECYLVNKDGFMITPSRFKDNTVLNQKIDKINLKDFLKTSNNSNNQNQFSRYINYMNVSVLCVNEFISKMDWFLVVEIDESEVFKSVDNMQNILTIIFSITGTIVLIFAIFYSKSITKPIEKLELYANQISNGNLDIKADIKTSDEIESLANSFNKMSESLKKYNQKLEDQVKKRTEELKNKVDELEKFKKVTVGRELKMAELKKEIQRYKQGKNTGGKNIDV